MKIQKCDIPYTLIIDNLLQPQYCDYIINKYKSNRFLDYSADCRGFRYNNLQAEQGVIDGLLSAIKTYQKYFPNVNYTVDHWTFSDVIFKWFTPGNYFSTWHCEHTKNYPYRIIGFQIYLSTHDCGTEFLENNDIILSKTGRCLVFPAFFTHIHKGQPCPENKDRFLLSTYIQYV